MEEAESPSPRRSLTKEERIRTVECIFGSKKIWLQLPKQAHNDHGDQHFKPDDTLESNKNSIIKLLESTLEKSMSALWISGKSFESVQSTKNSSVPFEIDIYEYTSGRVLLDAKANYRDDEDLHLTAVGIIAPPGLQKRSRNVHARDNRRITSATNSLLDVHEIARLSQSFLAPVTLILTWQQNMLRLPKRRLFPLKLELVFPLLFPGHELVGRNHEALVDALQLRLLTQIFERNCQRLEDRESWPTYQPSQTTLDDWLDLLMDID
ncbi:MAG: hypothetical protein Q9167_005194 [Letrouitia subvulpina]